MKIAIVGCGALGSFYGAKLCRAGHEVHFLLRSDYEVVHREGVTIHSAEGDWHVQPLCARSPEDIGTVDLVVIGLKTTGNHILARTLPPLVGPNTAVLTLQNGLGNEELIASIVGEERTMGGLCFVCLNRTAPGHILHVAHATIVLGEFRRQSQPRTHDLAKVFAEADVPCKVSEDLAEAHWEKLVWNIPFNGLGVAGTAGREAVLSGELDPSRPADPCPTTDVLLDNGPWEKLVRELILETIHAAQALGLAVKETAADRQIERTRDMGAYKASTLIDFERGQALELHSLFQEPLRQAEQAGANCPRLKAMCQVLEQIAARQPK